MGVIAGIAGVVVTVWATGAGAVWVHPADKRRAINKTIIPVLKYFIDCIIRKTSG
jgi:hypothetical protein